MRMRCRAWPWIWESAKRWSSAILSTPKFLRLSSEAIHLFGLPWSDEYREWSAHFSGTRRTGSDLEQFEFLQQVRPSRRTPSPSVGDACEFVEAVVGILPGKKPAARPRKTRSLKTRKAPISF